MGIMAIVFGSPLYLVRLNVFGVPSTALELGIYTLFIVWLAKNRCIFIYAHTPSNSPYKGDDKKETPPLLGEVRRGIIQQSINLIKKEKILFLGILLLMSGVVISTIFSSDLKASAGILKGWFFDPFLFFIILVSEIKTLKQRENILKAFYVSGVLAATVSLLYLFFPESNGVSYDGRLHGFYLSPNYLAMYLSPALIIGIWLIYRTFSIDLLKEKIAGARFFLSAVCLFALATAIYFTFSYAAWIAIIASVILLICLMAPPKKRKILFAVSFLILFVLFFSQDGTDKFENLKKMSYRSSYNSRLMIWNSAWEIGKDNWLVGIGPGNFQKYYLDYQKRFAEPYLEWAVPEPHNIFLAFWLETGIAGLLGFLIILAWFFKKSARLLGLTQSFQGLPLGIIQGESLERGLCKENFLLAVVLFSLMIYALTHGLLDTTYWKNDLAIIFWLNLALLVSIKR